MSLSGNLSVLATFQLCFNFTWYLAANKTVTFLIYFAFLEFPLGQRKEVITGCQDTELSYFDLKVTKYWKGSIKFFSVFKSNILKFIPPSPNSVYNCHNPRGIFLITRLKLDLSHLRQHKFKHGFQDTLNPLCSCGNDVESTEHFLLRCPKFVNERHTLLSSLGIFNCSLLENTSKVLTQTLLFGNASLSPSDNSQDP